ncbi:hypothetical protein LR48_Vigan09g069500 [Vigna angularis]|uniref:Uncharacterized protein n=1 Tax=Phaseolus angularis TaxID=3914 RepID=A0A0L9VAE5_PHAAN|nr:hypothetical protein LR48_Vigan09g069500 [Vigna angularis]
MAEARIAVEQVLALTSSLSWRKFRVRFAMGFGRGGLGFSAFSSLDLMQVSDAMIEEMMSLTSGCSEAARKKKEICDLGLHGNWDFLISGFAGDEDECAATMEVGDNGLWFDEDDVGGTTWLTATLARKRLSSEGEEEGNRTAKGSEATERGRAVKKKEDTERLKHKSRSFEDFPI